MYAAGLSRESGNASEDLMMQYLQKLKNLSNSEDLIGSDRDRVLEFLHWLSFVEIPHQVVYNPDIRQNECYNNCKACILYFKVNVLKSLLG